MAQVWLRPNRRAVLMGMIPPALVGGIALVVATGVITSLNFLWLRIAAWIVTILAACVLAAMIDQLRRPRVAYDHEQLFVNLRGGPAIPIPLEHVECFLLGQSSAHLPGDSTQQAETATVVVRLSEKATDYARRDVKPALGSWCDGNVTIRGTWCEPLDVQVVNRLNRQLAQVNRELAEAK